jgi:hypothetical protein
MRDSDDAKVRFLWERLVVSTRPDPSDAGMAYFLATGDEQCDPAKLRRLLDDNTVPPTVAARRSVRLEAENFRELDGFELEDRGDRTASHRLNVKLAQKDAGTVKTRFAEPYAVESGRHDIEVRYFDESNVRGKFSLLVNGAAKGSAWESAGEGGGWTTQTLSNIEIRAGDEITVQVQGSGARVDYVQLNSR